MNNLIANPSLAPEGEKSYEWAYAHMPALGRTVEKLAYRRPLKGRRIGVCLHVTKETSVLVFGLQRLGAEVYLCAANPLSTQDDVAAYLASKGVTVLAWRGETTEEYFNCMRSVLRARPEIMMDDGADAHVTLHEDGEFGGLRLLGGTEETTTGAIRLRALEGAGHMRYPIIIVNNAQSKFLFDNRYGTGQSTFDGILRATSLLIAGKRVVICGYGWVGKGLARRARGLDAHVIVVEVDPLKALEAHLDGFDAMPMREAARVGDIFITATGQISVIRGEHIEEMKDGAILANSGHFDVEIEVKYLEQNCEGKKRVRPYTDEYLMRSGKRVYLVGQGRVANLVAAEGHPPEVMAMSFSNQLLSVVYISENHDKLERRLYNVPKEIDRDVAMNALEAMGISIDRLTEEQIRYSESWA